MIRRLGFALALGALTLGAPLAASAAPKKEEAPKAYEKEQLAQGKKDAPAQVQAAGVTCNVADAAFVGSGSAKGADGKTVKQSVYEVACTGSLGYIIVAAAGAAPQAYDCLTASEGTVKCKLPENADPKAALQPIATATGKTCTVSDGRAMGASSKGDKYFEVKCQQGAGYVLQVPPSGTPIAVDCATQVGTAAECKLTSKAEIEAAQKQLLTQLLAKSGKTCALSGSRSVGALTNGSTLYEVACGPTAGYMLMADAKGGVTAIDCGKATGIGGGCTLTNSAVAETQEAATYTRLAGASGFPCKVSKYRYIGMQEKAEVVELVCSDRPDGAVAVFPADNGRGKIYDCVSAGALGQRCQFSKPDGVYAKYTQALKARGKTTCTVSNARWMGAYTQSNTDLIETACADGAPGWVVEVDKQTQIKNVYSCGQAKSQMSNACQLPTNVKG